MKILIGYSMRSGSTLLQHILNGHSQISAYGDLSSFGPALHLLAGLPTHGHVCIKPMDLLYLQPGQAYRRCFDRFIWLARDPRDSYLSTIESGYAYLFWLPGRKQCGIDIGLLRRWQQIYRHYFTQPQRWYLMKYEALVADPDRTLGQLFEYLELPFERLYPFAPFDLRHGGDFKITRYRDVSNHSRDRYRKEMSPQQMAVCNEWLGDEMRHLGYLEGADADQSGCTRLLAAPVPPKLQPVS